MFVARLLIFFFFFMENLMTRLSKLKIIFIKVIQGKIGCLLFRVGYWMKMVTKRVDKKKLRQNYQILAILNGENPLI